MSDDNGLYYMRARYYNIDIKRFINQDVITGSIDSSPSLNRYTYVEGNPVSYIDPFGLEPYDTEGLHKGAKIVGSAATIIGILSLGPLSGLGSVAAFVSVGAGGFNIGLTIYDISYSKDNNTGEATISILEDMGWVGITIISQTPEGKAYDFLLRILSAVNELKNASKEE